MDPSDHELLCRVAAGDQAAFEQLRERFEQPLRRHLAGMVRDPETAEDLLQETLLRAWSQAGSWTGQGSPQAWLYRIATNQALNHVRTRRRRPEVPLDPPRDDEDEWTAPGWMVDAASLGPEAVAEQREEQALLRQLVDGLPLEQRAVVRMVCEADSRLADVARSLGIPLGTVKSRLHYATRDLARRWRALEDGED